MLTKKMLVDMPPDTIFAAGVVQDLRIHANPVRWLAKRGGYHDWAIYYGFANDPSWPDERIASNGDKMITENVIRTLVPCDCEAWHLYRY